jgi:hypothetical protein
MIGIPLSIYCDQVNGIPIGDIASDADSIQWSISDQFGFESMDVVMRGTIEDVLFWFSALRSSAVVYGPDADTCWEGFLNAVDATIGQETHSRSLDTLANTMRVRYTTVLGSPAVTADQTDADSITAYGTKHGVERIGETTSTAAIAMCTRILNNRRWPGKQPSTSVSTGDVGAIEITLHFVGWYGALDWLLTASSTTTNAVTTTQVTNLLTAYNAINSFFSTDTTFVLASALNDTQYIPDDTTYRSAIERLLSQGDSSGTRYAWGVYEDKVFWAQLWNSVYTRGYRRTLSGGIEATLNGTSVAGYGTVNLWNLRPNAIVEIEDLLDIQPQSTEIDAAAKYYVARVTFRADSSGMSATLEPTDITDITAQLARLNRN